MKHKRKISNFLDKYKKEINIISIKFGIPKKDVEDILEHFFETFKDWIKSKKMPTISIEEVFTFKPSEWKLKKYLRKYFYHYRRGNTPPEKLRKAITKVWKIIKRLQKEKNKVYQHKIWNHLNPEELIWKTPDHNTSDSESLQKTETNSPDSTESKQ